MRRTLFFLAMIGMLSAGGAAVRAQAPDTSSGWRDRCAPDEVTKRPMCTAYHAGMAASGKVLAVIFVTPLAGGQYRVQVSGDAQVTAASAQVRVDRNAPRVTTQCKGSTCTFGSSDSAMLVKLFAGGHTAVVEFGGTDKATRPVSIPLAGFDEAIRTARDRTVRAR